MRGIQHQIQYASYVKDKKLRKVVNPTVSAAFEIIDELDKNDVALKNSVAVILKDQIIVKKDYL